MKCCIPVVMAGIIGVRPFVSIGGLRCCGSTGGGKHIGLFD
jgi:hypothetical protein